MINNATRIINNRPVTQVMLDSTQILRPVDFLILQLFESIQEEDEAQEYKRLKLFRDRLSGTLDMECMAKRLYLSTIREKSNDS